MLKQNYNSHQIFFIKKLYEKPSLPLTPLSSSLKHPFTIRGVIMPNQQRNNVFRGKTKTRYCYGWDWVEFTATMEKGALMPNDTASFVINESSLSHRFYKEVFEVWTKDFFDNSILFATIARMPRVSYIPEDIVQVKIDNNFCYNSELSLHIGIMLNQFGLTFKNYVRLDVFADFQEINHFESPQDFLRSFSRGDFQVKNKRNYKISRYRDEVTGIKFGGISSDVSVTMYNKTLEMIKKTWKPHIEDLWTFAGFDLETDVYRLEFRTKKTLKEIYCPYSGEMLPSYEDYLFIDTIDTYFKFLYNTHFQLGYKKNDAELQRFSRLTPYIMLAVDAQTFVAQVPSSREKSNNYVKCYIKKMALDAVEYKRNDELHMCGMLISHIQNELIKYGWALMKWYKNKILPLLEGVTVENLRSENLLKKYMSNKLWQPSLSW